jgi:hypothetical protein
MEWSTVWDEFSSPENQKTLGFLGSGADRSLGSRDRGPENALMA